MDKTRLELAAANVARSVALSREAVRLLSLGDEEAMHKVLAEARRELQKARELSEQIMRDAAVNDH